MVRFSLVPLAEATRISTKLLWALLVLSLPAQAADGPPKADKPEQRTWDFDSDAVGKLPSGFKSAVGDWSVADWSVAAGGKNHVLAQSARNEDAAFNVVLIDDTNYADIDLTVQLKAVGGKVDQGGGLVWRARDARNYYVARFNPLEDNFRVYKVVDGKRTQLATAKVPAGGDWHKLRITMQGPRIECFLNDKLYLEADDSTFRGAGRIGLWSKSDAHTFFDDLVAIGAAVKRDAADEPAATREFEINNDRARLGATKSICGASAAATRCSAKPSPNGTSPISTTFSPIAGATSKRLTP